MRSLYSDMIVDCMKKNEMKIYNNYNSVKELAASFNAFMSK